MKDISLTYRDKFLRNQASFNAKYKKLFDKVANDISLLVSDPNIRFSKSFNFNPSIEKKITAIVSQFQSDNLKLTEAEISESWRLSNDKNDEIVKDYIKTVTGLKTAETAKLFIPNTPALEAFIARDRGAGTLSDAIWKVAEQLRGEVEIHLGMGITNGDSSQVISRRIRKYLENPESLFRRVRDKNGNLVASKAMIANKPGQGVYNSAYKNSMRVARTETNAAYLASDNERWNNLDFVIGIKISLSEQHKIIDICDECQGEYPKEFYWTGWHICCLCHATPILMPQSDFERSLAGEDVKAEPITEMPENFNQYMKDNYERYTGYKSQPYFMQDNEKIINGIMKGEKAVAPVASESKAMNKMINAAKRDKLDTEKLFSKNGVYNPERYKLHQKIVNDLLGEVQHTTEGKNYFLGGATANGKSTLVNSGMLPHPKGILSIDSDKIKSMIPEYKHMIAKGDHAAAKFVHEESSHISKLLMKEARDTGKDFVLDGVNDGKFESLIEKVRAFKSTGQSIRADYVTLDSKLSLQLAKDRADKTGRWVPQKYIRSANSEISHLIPKLIENKTFDELYLWDTNINKNPRLILSQIKGKLTIHDQSLYNDFLRKAK